MATLADRAVIVGSVAKGPYRNLGNSLIERATLRILGLPHTTPTFSVFEPMTRSLARQINKYDLVLFTGCTILQMSEGHQRFLNDICEEVRISKFCFASGFCCEQHDNPPLDVARWFNSPVAVRDPWTANYLTRMGISNQFVGCPTLLVEPRISQWRSMSHGVTLISSTPRIHTLSQLGWSNEIQYVRHEPSTPGKDIREQDLFNNVRLCITGRLHLALPAIAKGIPVRFFGPSYWLDERVRLSAGLSRLSLLKFLKISMEGELSEMYPTEELDYLRTEFQKWKQDCHF